MIKVNNYFEGRVASLAFEGSEGKATVGVMKKGSYEFGTSSKEIMTVLSGSMKAQLPGSKEWKTYKKYESFEVAAHVKFQVEVSEDTPYLCFYE